MKGESCEESDIFDNWFRYARAGCGWVCLAHIANCAFFVVGIVLFPEKLAEAKPMVPEN